MKKKEDLLVTVLMSMYNTPEYQLRQAIESILSQTYSNFEFLIIDDCCSDNSLNVVKSYNDSRIKIVRNKKNMGLVVSLNKGLKIAKGKYIVRMDTDDISYPNRIEVELKYIIKNPEYSIISSRVDIFDNTGIYGENKINGKIETNDLLFGTPFIHPSMIINKKDILLCGSYPDYKRCEDYAMVMNMYAKGYRGYIINEKLLMYRLDRNGYKKKKHLDRIFEFKAKKHFFKKMNVKWYKKIFILKPLILMLVPNNVLSSIHKIKFGMKKNNIKKLKSIFNWVIYKNY